MFEQDVTWLPVHTAAAAIINFLEIVPGTQIVHLINPRPVSWSTLANIIAADRDVPLVPYTEWLSQLENVAQEQTRGYSKSFRALRLLPFFRSQNHQTAREAFGFPRVDAANSIRASKSLRSAGCQLGEKDVKKWIGYWREAGLFKM
jgi:dTDP-4-dehydrorhamnose reductase